MGEEILRLVDLNVAYQLKHSTVRAVRDVSLRLKEGEDLGIIGESGSGKSSLASAVMRSDVPNRLVSGQILYRGRDLLAMSEKEFDRIRWSEIAMVFQNSLDILNPVMPVGEQIAECVRRHKGAGRSAAKERAYEVLRQVMLPEETYEMLPHQLSGGMRQRALVAMAVSCAPRLLIADEPTSAVDEETKGEMIRLLLRLKEEMGLTLIVISHEIQTVAAMTSRLAVLYGGRILEEGRTGQVIRCARHIYTRGLLSSSPQIHPYRDLWGLPEDDGAPAEGCPFLNRCPQRVPVCAKSAPELRPLKDEPGRSIACHCGGLTPLLTVDQISKTYKGKKTVTACRDCTFELYCGEVVSVVGPSGAGKSTLALICSGIERADSGSVRFLGRPVEGNSATSVKGGLQIVFQDPFSSINSRMSVFSAISEPLRVAEGERDAHEPVRKLLRDVGLPDSPAFMERPCASLSGGQRQRVSVARALALEPKLLIADEICSMLDPSTQANLLRMLKGLQQSRGLGLLFISHDELLCKKIADRVFRLENGRMSEVSDSLLKDLDQD